MEHPKQEFGALWLLFCFCLHLALLAKDTLTHLRFPFKPGWLQTHNQKGTRVRGLRNQSHPANYEDLILLWQVMLQKVDKLICATCDTHILQQTDIFLCFNLRSLIWLFLGQKFTSSFRLPSRERTQAAQFAHFLLQFALGREDVTLCSSPINTTVDAPSLNTWLIYYIYKAQICLRGETPAL